MQSIKTSLYAIDTSSEVSNREKTFLVRGADVIPIFPENNSKYSLSFRYMGRRLHRTDEPVKLLIKNNGETVELGPCQVLSDSAMNGHGGRLVFSRDVYDFGYLLEKNKIMNLLSPLDDLPDVLSRRAAIRPEFREYTANLTFDLNVYKNLFDDIDAQYSDEDEVVRNSVQQAIIESRGPAFFRLLDENLDRLQSIVADYGPEEHQRHGFYFRKQLWNFIMCSALIARTNLKPRGYAGDSEMMRLIYANEYLGDSTFSKLMHKHAVEHPAAQSVRNRIELIANFLNKESKFYGASSDRKMKVLSVGSGPALELQKILKSPQDCDRYQFTLLDQDPLAHSEAGALIADIESGFNRHVRVDFLKCSVRTMLFSRKLQQKVGRYDFIYSMGLFDYLAAPVAKAVLKNLYRLLEPGGRMVIGNFHVLNPSTHYMQYWCDWQLYQRTEEEFKTLLEDEDGAEVSVIFEHTRSQMFLSVKKPADA